MASLGAMLKDRGFEVTGSDEGVYPPMSDFLAQRRIDVRQGYGEGNLSPAPDLVVVGNALSRGNPEVERALDGRIPLMSLPEALKTFFLRERTPVVVTGTHGKTTTTSMIAWGLASAGRRPDFLVGGIAENFQSSYGLGAAQGEGAPFVIEGDEYDSAFFDKGPKFLHYLPWLAVVGNVEFDHADIYGDLDAVKLQFRRFVNLIPRSGFLAVGSDSPGALDVCRDGFCDMETFGIGGAPDWGARDIRAHAGGCDFAITYRGEGFISARMGLFGDYNVRNALAATAVLHRLGVPAGDIRKGLETFAGVRRRLQLRAEVDGVRVYEDFAHHPTAVRETLAAVRAAFRPERLWAVYEPRSATSRRNVFQGEIAEALSLADCVALPPLFRPEKVPAAERLDEGRLVADLRARGAQAWSLGSADGIAEKVGAEARPGDLVVIMSNGGFDGIYEKLPARLRARSR
jgi:UDP-N-acetylmuramate: L-alanyl-gamma-D-glutamyl-meso-diaminopimelate ligase